MNKITPQNMHAFCRTCLKKLGEKFSIYENENFEELIASCTSIPMENYVKLPEFVCRKCYTKLRSFYEFRCKTLQSHCILNNIIKEFNGPNSSGNLIGMDSGQESDESLQNSGGEQDLKLQFASSDKTVKRDYGTGIFESEEEIEINGADIVATYSPANVPEPPHDKDSLDSLETVTEVIYEQNDDFKLQNSDISIHSPVIQDKNVLTELEEIPKIVTSKRTRISKSKKPLNKNVRKSDAKHKQMNRTDSGDSGSNFQCDQCPRRCVTRENYEAHLRTHQGLKPFVCKECGNSFTRADHCRTHVREVHASATLQFKCSFEGCSKIFNREGSYKMHYRLKHTPAHLKREPKNYVCEDCGNTYKNITTFKEHRYKHAPVEDYPFKCDECGKKFRSKRRFKEHEFRHSGVKNFVCPHCGMRKATKNELRTHINYHTKEKQWPCPKCTSVFNSSANLGMHDRVVHKGIRRFACKYCDQSFGKPDTLKHHEMRHTGEKPHGCEVCGKRFIQLVALRTHMKVHNKECAQSSSKISITEKSIILS